MAVSVTDPLGSAIERAKLICFQPFDIGKWFTLGFCAWLSMLGRSGGPNCNCTNFNSFNNRHPTHGPGSGPGDTGGPGPDEFLQWIDQHLALSAGIVIGVIVLALAVACVVQWISARGTFMFIDGIVHNRAEVERPWKQFVTLGNSLFKLRFALTLISTAFIIAVGGGCLAIVWPDLHNHTFSPVSIAAGIGGGLLAFMFMLVIALIDWVLVEFVAPVMYMFNAHVGEAFGIFRRDVLAGHVGSFVLYFLMKIALGIGAAVIAGLVTCLTCCLAALPYIGTVILLPLLVFFQCYPLYFLEQFGEPFRVFPVQTPPVTGPAPLPPAADQPPPT